MTIMYYRNNVGRYVGAFDTPQPDLIECDPPSDARQVWLDSSWGDGPTPPYEISKVEIIRRMTTAEATSAELLIASADAKFRLMWNSANVIRSSDEWFPTLHAALAGAFGEERADQILAPVANS